MHSSDQQTETETRVKPEHTERELLRGVVLIPVPSVTEADKFPPSRNEVF